MVNLEEYKAGSIVRIRLQNFLTYRFLDFECGPHLNFVLGPNGGGKSSLVCAMLLGLSGKPEYLQRSPKLSGFVQTGQKGASIEITLKDDDDSLVVIQRIFSADDDRSSWKINGERATKEAVQAIVKKLKIEVESLCNFLPQERVHSLARLSQNQLLLETMQTTGGEEMLQQYDELVKYRDEDNQFEKSCEEERKEIEALTKRNAAIEVEVKRHEQVEGIRDKIRLLKLKLPFLKYREKADEYNLKVEEKKAIKKKLDEAKELSAPTHNEIKRAHEEAERARKAVHELGNELETKQMAIKEILDRLKGEQEKIGKCAKDLDRQEEMKKAKTKECKNLKASIRKLTTEIENRIDPTERMEELKEQRRQLQRESREVKGDKAAVDKKLQDAKTDMVRLEHNYASINQELRALTDARQKKLRSLQNWDMNTYSISHWISQSRNLFSAKISDPLFMEVTVRNLNYANMIESIVGRNLKLAFVCRTKNDYDKLLYHANDQMKKSVNVLHFEGCDLQSYEPPMPREALRKLGFDGYAIDFIDAEDSIKIALCDQANFHRIPIAMRPVNHDLVVRAGIYNYLADNRHVAVIKSKYGAQLATTKTSVCDKAKNWGGEQVDKSKVASLNQELADIAAKMNEKKAIQADLLKVATAFEQKEMEAVEALTQLNEEFRRLTEKEKEIRQKQANLKIKEENLVKLQKEISEMTTQQIEQRMVNAVERKVELTLKLKKFISDCTEILADKIATECTLVESKLFEMALEEKCKIIERQNTEITEEYERIKSVINDLKAEAKALVAECGELTEEENALLEQLPSDQAQIENMIQDEETKLSLSNDVDLEMVNRYKEREKIIAEIKAKLAKKLEKRERLNSRFNDMKAQWETKLLDIVNGVSQRFSSYFKKVSEDCEGAVRLKQDDHDYRQWGIQIMVRYRKNEELVVLDASRQSGGEKSVATMLYLMSLQSFSTCPFRVVDEINQGMDPRNERLIHRQIVETVCVDKSQQSQYFLLTPKLLPDLVYHPKMRILVVYNGVDLPKDKSWKSCTSDKWLKTKEEENVEVIEL